MIKPYCLDSGAATLRGSKSLNFTRCKKYKCLSKDPRLDDSLGRTFLVVCTAAKLLFEQVLCFWVGTGVSYPLCSRCPPASLGLGGSSGKTEGHMARSA